MKTNEKCKMKNEKVKILQFAICILPFALLVISGCIGFQVAGEVQAGRSALLVGKAEEALPRFQRAAEMDPNYIMSFSAFQEGVWTYVGRTQYVTGKLPEARQSLERAVSRYDDDYLARIYLGLALARAGDRPRGAKEMTSGMKGLHDWLEFIAYNTRFGQFWDPLREIRSEIQSNLAMISGKEIDWQKLIASGEWVGRKMEEEIDLARRDEIEDQRRHTDGGGGGEP